MAGISVDFLSLSITMKNNGKGRDFLAIDGAGLFLFSIGFCYTCKHILSGFAYQSLMSRI
jgi:hypothetical protein